jgi:hypothetical protein
MEVVLGGETRIKIIGLNNKQNQRAECVSVCVCVYKRGEFPRNNLLGE